MSSADRPFLERRRKTLAVLVVARRVDADLYSLALNGDGRLEVCGTAATLEEAERHVQDCGRCDVALIRLRERSGLPVARTLRTIKPTLHLAAIGLSEEPQELTAWAQAGTLGLIGRDASVDELVNVLLLAGRGEPAASATLAGVLFRQATTGTPPRPPLTGLTRREREVVELLAREYSNQEIARALTIQISTAKNHVHNILTKLQLHHRHEAAAWLETHPPDPNR